MATFGFVHGAGSDSGDWRPVTPELRRHGHDVVAVDLPCEDESAGLAEYADTVVAAVGDRTDLVVVGHSLGGFTAPADDVALFLHDTPPELAADVMARGRDQAAAPLAEPWPLDACRAGRPAHRVRALAGGRRCCYLS